MRDGHIIIGTAGHIDHGKSTLVKALTGMDPDRLAEEKERGLTIDIGFAFYGDKASFIDVPGHEKFIKNMVAGVTTIDMAILLIAADDGVMPQTREHLDILNILGVPRGFVVITKIDLVDKGWLELVTEDVNVLTKDTFLENAPILYFSAVSGEGISEIKKTLDAFLKTPSPKHDRGFFWMPIDRSFTIKGFGTVVTGSVLSGKLRIGESVELLPARRLLKVRGLQSHEKNTEIVQIGDRAAVNLASIAKGEITRGNVLASPNFAKPTKRIDAKYQHLKNAPRVLKNQARVRFHVGTSELFARIRFLDRYFLDPGDSSYCQIFFEKEVAVNRMDRFVVRQYSPQITMGGGIVLDNHPIRRHKRFSGEILDHLKRLESEDAKVIIQELLINQRIPLTIEEIASGAGILTGDSKTLIDILETEQAIQKIKSGQKIYVLAVQTLNEYAQTIIGILHQFHRDHPFESGISKAELHHKFKKNLEYSVFQTILVQLQNEHKIAIEADRVRLPDHSINLNEKSLRIYHDFIAELKKDKFRTRKREEYSELLLIPRDLLDNLIRYGRGKGDLFILSGDLLFSKESILEAKNSLSRFFERNKELKLTDFKNLLGTTRKYAVPLIEYFDSLQFTERNGDVRILKNS